jgi:predicted dinucleotide-binding enzyme
LTQTIGFIGSGMISSQLARLAIAAGFDVTLSNSRGPETLADLVAELGDHAHAATPVDVARESDLVVASIPFVAYSKLPTDALAGKVVIDTMNFYPERDGEMAEVTTDTVTTSELVQRHLVRSQVIRALNNLDWVRLLKRARPAGSSERSAVPMAGEHGLLGALIRPIFNADSLAQARDRLSEAVAHLDGRLGKIASMLEDAEADILAFYAFPPSHWRKLRSTNPLERFNKEIGRRTDVVGIFPDDPSLVRLAGMLCIEQNDEWLVGRGYLSAESIALCLAGPAEDTDNQIKEEVPELQAA